MLTRQQNIEGREVGPQEPLSGNIAPPEPTKAKKKKKKSKKSTSKTQAQPEAKIVFISDEPAPHRDIMPLVDLMMPDDFESQRNDDVAPKSDDVTSEDSVRTLPTSPKSVIPRISPVAKRIKQAVGKTSSVVEAPPARRKQKRHSRNSTKDDDQSDDQADGKTLVVRQSQVMTPSSGEESDVRPSSPEVLFILTALKHTQKDEPKSAPSPRLPSESSADLATSSVRMKPSKDDDYNKWADRDRHSIFQGQSSRPAVERLLDALPQVYVPRVKEALAAMRGQVQEVISDDEERGELHENGNAPGSPQADSVIGNQDVVNVGEDEAAGKTSEE
jgi:hypothetical protein